VTSVAFDHHELAQRQDRAPSRLMPVAGRASLAPTGMAAADAEASHPDR
jgi:hypothetical protein